MIQKHDVRIDRTKLHPWLDYKLGLLLKKSKERGIYLIITEGFRTKEYQDSLYAKGRSAPGKIVTNAQGSTYSSQHMWGIAFDIAINDKNKTYDGSLLRQVAEIAKDKGVGLAWGGDWKSFPDTPHFYLGKWGSTTTNLKLQYGTPDKFKNTWTMCVRGTKRGLNIWNKDHTKIKKKKLPNGTKVEVMYTKTFVFGKFTKVRYNGIVGWMKSKYLA